MLLLPGDRQKLPIFNLAVSNLYKRLEASKFFVLLGEATPYDSKTEKFLFLGLSILGDLPTSH
jgi:hypothetical protein